MSRAHLALGVMAYASAPVWLVLLLLWTAETVRGQLTPHQYFPRGGALFPVWEVSTRVEARLLLGVVLVLLFVPRALAIAARLRDPEERRGFGGGSRMFASAVAEWLLSTLLAPVLMLEHSRFVASILLGRSVEWTAQPRDERGVGLREAAQRHGAAALLGAGWLLVLLVLSPRLLWWMVPVLAGMLLAIPLSMLSSRASAGRWAREHGLFLTPEEREPEAVLFRLRHALRETPAAPARGTGATSALERVLDDAALRQLHSALVIGDPGGASEREIDDLARKCRLQGPAALTAAEQRSLLRSPRALAELALESGATPALHRASARGRR